MLCLLLIVILKYGLHVLDEQYGRAHVQEHASMHRCFDTIM